MLDSNMVLAAAAIKAIRDLVDGRDKDVRKVVTEQYVSEYKETGIKSRDVLFEGDKVATATLSIPKQSGPAVSDRASFMRWVRATTPENVAVIQPPPVESVCPVFEEELLARLEFKDGEAVHPVTGEVIPGITPPHTPDPKSYSVKFADGGRERLLEAWRIGQLTELDEIPALTSADE